MTTALSAGVYQWRDANGNVVFGDNPPESAAVQEVDLPILTVADGYPSGDKDKKKKENKAAKKEEQQQVESKPKPVAQPVATVNYEHFTIRSPKKDAVLRSNNGNILIKFDLKPALQQGHGLVVYLDGKQVASGEATVFSLKAVDRGQHSVFAVLHNENNDVLKNTNAVRFSVLRASKR